ncbi:hypothetical protein L195_g045141 [Trifolium pratense]|uniref:Uncharacterized protein n=1 Tax=Trifolium pratense TaxID=57577 RepID=A0A2K3ME08_TRIPR|nr:hypothetical protein L195_g045141 [Trifolium pratense]
MCQTLIGTSSKSASVATPMIMKDVANKGEEKKDDEDDVTSSSDEE